MSGLETLPPDQRAVLQLILAQGRGYADLAATLKLDVASVRERALAGVDGLDLPHPAALDDTARGRIADYLLGQLDDGERIVAFAELGGSPDACAWAQALRERLSAVARDELPEVPAVAAAPASGTNGSRAAEVAASAPAVADVPAAAPAAAAIVAQPAAAAFPAPPAAAPPAAGATPPAPPAPRERGEREGGSGPGGPRPSRLGGAILIAGAAALAVVLAIVLIGGGDDNSGASGSTSGAQAQTSARTQTSTTGSAARVIGAAALRATPAGGSALGAAIVQRASGGRRQIAVEMARIAPNGAQDAYAIWLQGNGGARLLGFVPTPVGRDRTFTVSAALPSGLKLTDYATVLVTRETTTAQPTTPGTVIASGPLRLAN